MNITGKRVLVLAPHTDDAEFGCGGSINKMLIDKNDVNVVAFSSCSQSLRSGFANDTLINEMNEACRSLGLKKENIRVLNFQVRIFKEVRQEILEEMIVLREEINPDIVIIPSFADVHQDHITISEEALRAFKYSTILAYELPWNIIHQTNTCFMELNEENMAAKVNAISKYKSQNHRNYASEDFIYSLAKVRGVQANMKYSECFEVIRLYFN